MVSVTVVVAEWGGASKHCARRQFRHELLFFCEIMMMQVRLSKTSENTRKPRRLDGWGRLQAIESRNHGERGSAR
jgi:hypothetical protein